MLCGVTDSSLLLVFFQQVAPFYMVTVCKMLRLDTGILHLCSALHNTVFYTVPRVSLK